MKLYFIIYVAVLLYIAIPIIKIIIDDKLDNDLKFLLWINYLLLFLLSMIFDYYNQIIYSVFISFSLCLSSYFLIRKIKYTLNFYSLLSIPYLIWTTWTFSYIITLI